MKFAILFAALFGLASCQFNPYKPSYRQTGYEKYAKTLKQNYDISHDGRYQYGYETDNGITGHHSGYERNLGGHPPASANTVQGTFGWTSPEGKYISFGYTADENGYHPVGDAIPTPHPIPDYILRSIEYNKAAQRNNRFF